MPPLPRIASLAYGATLPFRAGRLIVRSPRLLFWSAIPIALTLALYTFGIREAQLAIETALQGRFAALGWSPEGWTFAAVLLVVRITLLIAGAATFSLIATILASPFNDLLAEAAEPLAEPPLPVVPGRGWRHQLRLLRIDLLKSALAGLATLFALLLAWVPGLNLLLLGLAFLMVTFQFTSYPQTRRGVTVRGGLAFLWRHAWACGGFGLVISALFSLPLIASLALPLAVVGGTLLVARAPAAPALR